MMNLIWGVVVPGALTGQEYIFYHRDTEYTEGRGMNYKGHKGRRVG
jgi:hypothetical protein